MGDLRVRYRALLAPKRRMQKMGRLQEKVVSFEFTAPTPKRSNSATNTRSIQALEAGQPEQEASGLSCDGIVGVKFKDEAPVIDNDREEPRVSGGSGDITLIVGCVVGAVVCVAIVVAAGRRRRNAKKEDNNN